MFRKAFSGLMGVALGAALSLGLSGAGWATALTERADLSLQGPGFAIAEGGVGLANLQTSLSETISVAIPAGATVERAFLYWVGRDGIFQPGVGITPCITRLPNSECTFPAGSVDPNDPAFVPYLDQELVFDGNAITGELVGFESQNAGGGGGNIPFNYIAYRADVTAFVSGSGSFTIEDGDFTNNFGFFDGAGLAVVYSDPTDPIVRRIIVYDGLDFAFGETSSTAPPARVAAPVVFDHGVSGVERTGQLVLFVGDADAGFPDRIGISGPNADIVNELIGRDGVSFDSPGPADPLMIDVTIPAGTATTTVQLFSEPQGAFGGPIPDSLAWVLVALSAPAPEPGIELAKQVSLTGGEPFFDADNSGDPDVPTGVIGADATYRLIVRNTGSETLINAIINDPTLGLVNVPVPGGPLNPGDVRVIDSGEAGFSLLVFDNRCDSVGNKLNIATVDAEGEFSGIPVSDDDPANVNCISEPAIQLVKQVSLTGGDPFFDADTPASGPTGPLGADATYRLVVRNVGNEVLVNAVITDATLGLFDVLVPGGALNPGDERVILSGDAGFANLFVTGRCDSVGNKLNVAMVEAEGEVSGIPVSDENPANVNCSNPQIELLKQVSLTGGDPFFDADTPGTAPVGSILFGTDATYRLIVRNIGTETLTDLMVSDATLGLFDVPVPGGDLLPGEERTIVSGDTGFGNLVFLDRCDQTGNKSNIATVEATGTASGTPVSDDDPANVNCIEGPAIELLKQVSLTGGVPFFDADTPASGPTGPLGSDATYRLIVRNVGDETLVNAVVSDATLGLANVPVPGGPLLPGDERVISTGDFGFGNLFFPNRCDSVGTQLNIARVDAQGENTGDPVSDDNPANVSCIQEQCTIAVNKTCLVAAPPPDDLLCEAKIAATTLRYIGPDRNNATVVFDGTNGGLATYTNVNLVSGVTILTQAGQNGFTINGQPGDLGSKTSITIDGIEEIIHTSCSAIYAAGQPAPLDGGTPNPPNSSKGDPSPNWFVVNFVDKNGGFVEVAAPSQGADVCEIAAATGTLCTKRPTAISLRYNAGDCSQSMNTQDPGKVSCDGDAGVVQPVRIVVSKDDGSRVSLDTGVASVNIGDVVTATAANAGRSDLDSNSLVRVFDGAGTLLQEVEFHTSCSQDLRIGDRFGSVEVVGFVNSEQGTVQSGANVGYAYKITNTGSTAVDLTSVLDDRLGELLNPSPQSLGVGDMLTLLATAFIATDTTNIVTVSGNVAGSPAAQCVAVDTATVKVVVPPIPPASCADGKPKALTFEYTGGACDPANDNGQSGKFSCLGNPMGAEPVQVVVTKDTSKVSVTPNAETVGLGGSFTIAKNDGKSLPSEIGFDIRQGGITLQSLAIHASCSKPLNEGDRFGSVILRTFVPK